MSGGADGLDGLADVRLVRELFPFCFTLDRDMRIAMAGSRWESFEPGVRSGAAFHELFDLERRGADSDWFEQRNLLAAPPLAPDAANALARLRGRLDREFPSLVR